jgi:hypothetical protein
MNGTVENGCVARGERGWVELGDGKRSDGAAGTVGLTVIGSGSGSVEVRLNWLSNQTVAFDDATNTTVTVDMLRGDNVLTILQALGTP